MDELISFISLMAYLAGTAGYIATVLRRRPEVERFAFCTVVLGAIAHMISLGIELFYHGHLTFTSSRTVLSLFTFLVVLLFLGLRFRFKTIVLGAFVMPLVVISMVGSLAIPASLIPENPSLRNGWVLFHLITLVIAYAFFAVSFCVSVVYLFYEKALKKKSYYRLMERLPSLEFLDRLNHLCVATGFTFMTIGLIAGFAAARFLWNRFWSGDPKEIFSVVTWMVYAVLFHERLAVGWRGRKASWLSICGFLCVMATFLGVNLLIKGHHTTFRGR